MSVDREGARKVARLARIHVQDGELDALSTRLTRILDFAEQLAEVDVEGVEPMTAVTPLRLKRRSDDATDGRRRNDILANAPESREGFFIVPKVVE